MIFKKINKKSITALLVLLFFALDFFPIYNPTLASTNASTIQNNMNKLIKKQAAVTQQLKTSQSLLQQNKVKVNTTKTVLEQTATAISDKEAILADLDAKIESDKTMLAEYIRQMYYEGQDDPLVELTVLKDNLNELSGNYDGMTSMRGKITDAMQQISDAKAGAEKAKADLADQKQTHEQILATQQNQQVQIAGDISDAQATLADLQKKFAELQSDLNKLLGSSYNASDIQSAVKYASDKTGVPVGFLVGVLKMETNLGANVGGCTYSQVESGAMANYKKGKLGKNAWATFQNRRTLFVGICKGLGIDYEKQKVSCNPSGYTGTGGAMGVAQFMPDTWNGYKSQVSSMTGHNPPNPWSLTDGVMAMALKLSRVSGVTSGSKSAFKTAACSYLGTCYAPYINGILYWAANYKTLLN